MAGISFHSLEGYHGSQGVVTISVGRNSGAGLGRRWMGDTNVGGEN